MQRYEVRTIGPCVVKMQCDKACSNSGSFSPQACPVWTVGRISAWVRISPTRINSNTASHVNPFSDHTRAYVAPSEHASLSPLVLTGQKAANINTQTRSCTYSEHLPTAWFPNSTYATQFYMRTAALRDRSCHNSRLRPIRKIEVSNLSNPGPLATSP